MIDKYLPVGSIVLLEGGQKRIINDIGRGERQRNTEKTWDYLACPYPEGFLGEDYAYLLATMSRSIESISSAFRTAKN